MDDKKDHPKESQRAPAVPATPSTKSSAVGYNGKEHDDVLRRINRIPLTADGKATVVTEGNVITVTMPNKSQWRLTMNEKTVPKPVTPDAVKTWEYIAAPTVAK